MRTAALALFVVALVGLPACAPHPCPKALVPKYIDLTSDATKCPPKQIRVGCHDKALYKRGGWTAVACGRKYRCAAILKCSGPQHVMSYGAWCVKKGESPSP